MPTAQTLYGYILQANHNNDRVYIPNERPAKKKKNCKVCGGVGGLSLTATHKKYRLEARIKHIQRFIDINHF